MADTVVFFKSNTTYTIPNDFGTLVAVEAIGAGGTSSANSTGGGGGAYAKSTSVVGLMPGSTVYISVPGYSDSFAAKFSTTINGPANSTEGISAASANNRIGGLAADSIGDVKFSGGNGGNNSATPVAGGGAGGGGAAGPGGNGGNGGNAYGSGSTAGGGGGGGAGGASTTVGASANSTSGGKGGTGGGGGAGGLGANSTVAAASGTNGGGGGGNWTTSGNRNSGYSSQYTIWTQTSDGNTAGPAGGVGGGNAWNALAMPGYGFGGASENGVNARGMSGGPGIVVLTYTPAVRNADFLQFF